MMVGVVVPAELLTVKVVEAVSPVEPITVIVYNDPAATLVGTVNEPVKKTPFNPPWMEKLQVPWNAIVVPWNPSSVH
jgi:hypothetical protein